MSNEDNEQNTHSGTQPSTHSGTQSSTQPSTVTNAPFREKGIAALGSLSIGAKQLLEFGNHFLVYISRSRLEWEWGRRFCKQSSPGTSSAAAQMHSNCSSIQSSIDAIDSSAASAGRLAGLKMLPARIKRWCQLHIAYRRLGAKVLDDPACAESCAQGQAAKQAIDSRTQAIRSRQTALGIEQAALQKKLGFDARPFGAIAVFVLLCAPLAYLHGQHGTHPALDATQVATNPSGSSASDSTKSAAAVPPALPLDLNDPELTAIAKAPPPGATVELTTTANQRFPDQVQQLLHAASDDEMTSRAVTAVPAPADLADKLVHSTDPLIRQLGEVEAAVTVEAPAFNKGSTDVVLANVKTMMIDPETHTEVTREFNGRGWQETKIEVDNKEQPGIEAAVSDSLNKLGTHYDLRFRLYTHMQELAAILRQIADRGGPQQPAGDAVKVGFNDDPTQAGTVVVSNNSNRTVHHCLVIVIGKQKPPVPDGDKVNAVLGALAGIATGTGGGPHEAEEAAMPSVSISYRDELKPGEGVVSTSCMSGQLDQVSSTTGALWCDEFESGDVQANDMADALQRMKARQAANSNAFNQSIIDQRKTVHVTSSNGVLLYQFLAYPAINSQAIVVPEGTQQVSVAYTPGAQVQEQVDGLPQSTGDPSFIVGSTLRFHIMSDADPTPVPVAVRFILRQPTPAETVPFTLPPWPPAPAPALPPQRQAQHAALVAWLAKSPTVDGKAMLNGQSTPQILHIHLQWDEQSSSVDGWVQWDRDGSRKSIEGRIIDDPDAAPVLTLWENDWLSPPSNFNSLIGLVYSLHVQEAVSGHLVIHHATYGDARSGRTIDETDAVKALVADDALTTGVPLQHFADPAPGIVKTLEVRYTDLDGAEKTATAREGQTMTISHPTAPRGSLTGSWQFGERTIFGAGRSGSGGVTLSTDVYASVGK